MENNRITIRSITDPRKMISIPLKDDLKFENNEIHSDKLHEIVYSYYYNRRNK